MEVSTLLGLVSPLVCFAIHIMVYRLVRNAGQMPRQKLAVLVVFKSTALIALVTAILLKSLPATIHAGALALLFGYIYYQWFNMSETARRIRMLVTYVAQGKMAGTTDGYDSRSIFENRIVRMLETGTIKEQNGKLVLNSTVLLWATRIIMFWRWLFYPAPKRS